MVNCELTLNFFETTNNFIKGLSIESLLWGNGDGALKVFED